MSAEEFIDKWRDKFDTDGSSLVGIVVNWDKINQNSKVVSFKGRKAWEKIFEFTPPWYEKENRLPFKYFLTEDNVRYKKEIQAEINKSTQNKYEYILENGLTGALLPEFVAFSNKLGEKGVLGDGCHRFIVANYISGKGLRDLSRDLENASLDIICLDNFMDVLPFDPFQI